MFSDLGSIVDLRLFCVGLKFGLGLHEAGPLDAVWRIRLETMFKKQVVRFKNGSNSASRKGIIFSQFQKKTYNNCDNIITDNLRRNCASLPTISYRVRKGENIDGLKMTNPTRSDFGCVKPYLAF